MPVRATKPTTEEKPVKKPASKEAAPPATINTSPLKLAVHAFLNQFDLMDKVTDEKERMSTANGEKIPTLFLVFDSDASAHLCALRYLQAGEAFGGAKNELICNGFPRTDEDEDDLIVVFQTVPREESNYDIDEKVDPVPRAKAFLKTTGVKHTILPASTEPGLPRVAAVEFSSMEECAEVAFAYIATNSTDDAALFICEADPDINDMLGFFAI